MHIRHLRHFVVLAETLHFGQAAKRLHMSQPPLSRQILTLEETLGFDLFQRNSRAVSLTPAGAAFYQQAKRLLDEFDFAVRSSQAIARGERGELRIGFTMCAAWSILPELLASFGEAFPDVAVTLHETLPKDLHGALLSGDVDVGISFPVPDEPRMHYQPLFQEPLCAVLPADHRLAQQPALRTADLADEAFITFPASTAPELHEAVMTCCQHSGFQPRIHLQTNLQQTIVNLVARGLGVSLVPESMRRMQLEGALFLSLDTSPMVEQGMFWNEHNQNPCLQPFLTTARSRYPQPD